MATNPIIRFDRKFQVWQYSVSHGQLLLRSTKSQEHQTQVDILFKDVIMMQLPTLFRDLAIWEISTDEFNSLELSTGLYTTDGLRCFRLEGDNWQGVVVAGTIAWTEDQSEHWAKEMIS